MDPDPIDGLLERLDKGDLAAQQDAVKGVFNEILKRVQDDISLLTAFERVDTNLITKIGKSLAIIGKPYLHVIGHMILIQGWGEDWKTFITTAFTLYQKQYLDLYHTAQGLFEFLDEKEKPQDSNSQTSSTAVAKSDMEKIEEKLSISKKNYKSLVEDYFKFYVQLLICIGGLPPQKTLPDD